MTTVAIKKLRLSNIFFKLQILFSLHYGFVSYCMQFGSSTNNAVLVKNVTFLQKKLSLNLYLCSNERISKRFKCPYHLSSTCRVDSWRRWSTEHPQHIVEVDSSLPLLFGWRTSDEPDFYFSTETVSDCVLADRVRYLWIRRTEQNQCFLC